MREEIVERFYCNLFWENDDQIDEFTYFSKMDDEIYDFMEELFNDYKENYIDDGSLSKSDKCDNPVAREFFVYCANLIKKEKNIEFDAEDFANFCWGCKNSFWLIAESCGEEAIEQYLQDKEDEEYDLKYPSNEDED